MRASQRNHLQVYITCFNVQIRSQVLLTPRTPSRLPRLSVGALTLFVVTQGACSTDIAGQAPPGSAAGNGAAAGAPAGAGGTTPGSGGVVSTGGAAGTPPDGTGGSGAGAWQPPPLESVPAYSPTARLTRLEYAETITRAFQSTNLVFPELPDDENVGLARNPEAPPLSDYETYVSAAIELGRQLAESGIAARCDWRANAPGCAQSELVPALETLYRSAAGDAERDVLSGVISDALSRVGDANHAVGHGIARTLLEPRFLYLVETGTATERAGGFQLAPYELASRLSYFLWDGPPDRTLLDLARSGTLTDSGAITTEANRLYGDARARDAIWRFIKDWLRLGDEAAAQSTLKRSMLEETRRFTEYVLLDGSAPLSDLFAARYSFINAELATHYGVPAPAVDWELYQFSDSALRRGILTHASFLSANSSAKRDVSWIFRGKIVYENLFCGHLPSPPDGAAEMQVESRLTAEACAGCHSIVDPVGMLFDNYDELGALRTEPSLSGSVSVGSDVDADYANLLDFAEAVKDSRAFEHCFAKLWFRQALGRDLTAQDQASLDAVVTAFGTLRSLRQLLVGVATSPAFSVVYPKPAGTVCR